LTKLVYKQYTMCMERFIKKTNEQEAALNKTAGNFSTTGLSAEQFKIEYQPSKLGCQYTLKVKHITVFKNTRHKLKYSQAPNSDS